VSELAAEKIDYGNWVSTRLVFAPGVLSLLFGGFSFLLPALGVVAVIFFLSFLYFAYARYLFSPRGGNIQSRIQDLLLDRTMGWDGVGKVLDIGCGNGPLPSENGLLPNILVQPASVPRYLSFFSAPFL
jgi:hypothetical protein